MDLFSWWKVSGYCSAYKISKANRKWLLKRLYPFVEVQTLEEIALHAAAATSTIKPMKVRLLTEPELGTIVTVYPSK